VASVTAVIPTLGESPILIDCLKSLRRDAGELAKILVVDQGPQAVELPAGLADRVLRQESNLGFAGGTNRGIAATDSPYIATVNDDVLVDPGWTESLLAMLEEQPEAAAVQGVNLRLQEPTLADGCGIAWNDSWQAVQLHHGEVAPPSDAAPQEIFGVSATAAIYRRRALEDVALAGAEPFDSRLSSYYEDVDLACRLRAAGHRAWLLPAVRAHHAGSTTGDRHSFQRWRGIYGNRYLVLARLLGRSFRQQVPTLAKRDLRDLGRYLEKGQPSAALGVAAGWVRAWRQVAAYSHDGEPTVPMAELKRFQVICQG
jgi:GT2 family glycosyltransferase